MSAPVKTYIIARRRSGVSHDELVGHWRSVHAPAVVERVRPDGYTLTVFDPRGGRTPWDGMAELRFDHRERARAVTLAGAPVAATGDGWHDLVEQPTPRLEVTEHVPVAGPGADGAQATTAEREAAFKLTFLISARDGVDRERVRRHWLDIHVPNFASQFVASGGIRYVVNLADEVFATDLVGVAELSYRDRASAERHQPPDDGFKDLIVLRAFPGREQVIV
jgi:hypothetical protein